jgi:hypothetical protein
MFVTNHARSRLTERMTDMRADRIALLLEAFTTTHTGKLAIIVGTLPRKVSAPAPEGKWWQDSNGEVIVAIAVGGSVETVFFRRASQDMTPEFFGVKTVIDLRGA